MAVQNHHSSSSTEHLPKVLLYGPPSLSSIIKPHPSHNFQILNLPSSLPLHQFLPTHASSIHAVVTTDVSFLVNADLIGLLPSLRLVVTGSAGTDHVDLSECRRRGIQVASAGNLYSDDVADLAVALLIDVTWKISAADTNFRRRLQPPSWDFPSSSKVCHFPPIYKAILVYHHMI